MVMEMARRNEQTEREISWYERKIVANTETTKKKRRRTKEHAVDGHEIWNVHGVAYEMRVAAALPKASELRIFIRTIEQYLFPWKRIVSISFLFYFDVSELFVLAWAGYNARTIYECYFFIIFFFFVFDFSALFTFHSKWFGFGCCWANFSSST